ncbi:MAG: nucleotidyltransferase family protein [Bacteroidetes bacterium]|nr:nucleotidyltransferase family protein [Bacteroidota bacterium]
MEAIILAGGFGTRLQTVVNDVPKSMAIVNGRPFLEYLLDYLVKQGVSRAVLSVGYKRELIRDHFKNRYRTLELEYAVEEEPLGTGGGIRLSFWRVKGDRAVVLNGDSLFRIELPAFEKAHLAKKADVTLALRKLVNTGRYGRVTLNRQSRISGFEEKNENAGPGLINAGVYLMEKPFLMQPQFRGKFSIEKDCFEEYFGTAHMFGYPDEGYFLDIGIPEDYQKAQYEFKGFEDR